jgi:hypothetical protein
VNVEPSKRDRYGLQIAKVLVNGRMSTWFRSSAVWRGLTLPLKDVRRRRCREGTQGARETSKNEDVRRLAKYALEFKLEAVRLVKAGQEVPVTRRVTARVLGIPKATLGNWICTAGKGEAKGAGDRPLSAEQKALARLRAGPCTAWCWSACTGDPTVSRL